MVSLLGLSWTLGARVLTPVPVLQSRGLDLHNIAIQQRGHPATKPNTLHLSNGSINSCHKANFSTHSSKKVSCTLLNLSTKNIYRPIGKKSVTLPPFWRRISGSAWSNNKSTDCTVYGANTNTISAVVPTGQSLIRNVSTADHQVGYFSTAADHQLAEAVYRRAAQFGNSIAVSDLHGDHTYSDLLNWRWVTCSDLLNWRWVTCSGLFNWMWVTCSCLLNWKCLTCCGLLNFRLVTCSGLLNWRLVAGHIYSDLLNWRWVAGHSHSDLLN